MRVHAKPERGVSVAKPIGNIREQGAPLQWFLQMRSSHGNVIWGYVIDR